MKVASRLDNEPELLAQAQGGDGDAFMTLVQHYDDRLRGLAWRILGDQSAMDDALQDAYLKAYKAIGTFRYDASFYSWMNRIVHNTCIDIVRRRRNVYSLEFAESVVDYRAQTEEQVARGSVVAQALSELHPDQRWAVLLVDGQGLSYDEAAEVIGVQRGTVASRLNRGRAEMRRLLGHDLEGGRS